MSSSVILVAFAVEGDTEQARQEALLTALQPVLESRGGPAECWWVAEDVRHDGSDNDSAVFVHPGAQGVASRVLHRLGLTNGCNVISSPATPGPWEPPEDPLAGIDRAFDSIEGRDQ